MTQWSDKSINIAVVFMPMKKHIDLFSQMA